MDGVEHVRHVVVRNFIFSGDERVLRYDNLLPYAELNTDTLTSPATQVKSPFLIGPYRDTLKVQVNTTVFNHFSKTKLWKISYIFIELLLAWKEP